MHYADDDADPSPGNGADEDPTSNTEFDGIRALLKEYGSQGLSKDEIQTYGIPAEEIEDAEDAGVIRLRQEDDHYLLCRA